jgi:hypothetical protein
MSQSLAKQCNEVKERYDTCFLKWYSEKYLRGAAKADNNECSALFKEYSECLQVSPLKAEDRKLGDFWLTVLSGCLEGARDRQAP